MRIWFDEKGGTHFIDVPFHPIEITFEQFCDFKTHEAKYFEANRISNEEARPGRTGKRAEAAKHFIETVAKVVKGDIEHIPFNVPEGEDVTALFGTYTVRPGDELSITRLYAHVVNTINSYRPDSIEKHFSVKLEGTEYHLVGNATEIVAGTAYTAGEVFETLEYQRRGAIHVERAPAEIGNIEFNLGLTEAAILLRKKGERLPSNETERRRFINERKQVFARATLDTILDLRFFLANTLVQAATTKRINTFGKAPLARSRRRKAKPKGRGRT